MREIRARNVGRQAALIHSYMPLVARVAIPLNICDQDGLRMDTGWPADFEKQGTLKISTIGRRTGRRHQVTIEFAVDSDGRIFIATRDKRRDWVRNVMKNPSVEVTIGGVTRRMKVIPLKTESGREYVRNLYAKKYLLARLGRLLTSSTGFARYEAFELKPE